MTIIVAAAQAAIAAAQASPVVIVPTTPVDALASALVITVPQDTPVELMATKEVNTDDALPGTIFKLRVNKPVIVDGHVVVPAGAPAFGQVLSAVDAGGLGRSGRMTAKLLNVRLGDVEIPLEGQMSAKGTGAGSAGVAVLFAGAMGLFHRGNNAKIKAGEILNGYVVRDVTLDLSGPTPRLSAAGSAGDTSAAQSVEAVPTSRGSINAPATTPQ